MQPACATKFSGCVQQCKCFVLLCSVLFYLLFCQALALGACSLNSGVIFGKGKCTGAFQAPLSFSRLANSAAKAKGRPGGGGGVGKKKAPQQVQQQRLLTKKGPKGYTRKSETSTSEASPVAPISPPRKWGRTVSRKREVPSTPDEIMGPDPPFGLVPDVEFELYKLFGRLGDPFVPHSSLPPCKRILFQRLFKRFTRFDGIGRDYFFLRVETDWRFVLPLMKDPLDSGAQQGICRGKDSRTKADKTDAVNWFEGLDVRLSKAWARLREIKIADEEAENGQMTFVGNDVWCQLFDAQGLEQSCNKPPKRTDSEIAFLLRHSKVPLPHIKGEAATRVMRPSVPEQSVRLVDARRGVSSDINRQGLHPGVLEALWNFFTEGQELLTQEQATRQIDKLFGADSDRPRLWREISEVPGLLDQKQKSDVSHIKNLFVKRGRLVYRDPSVAKDRRPNPRGSPHRLSFSRLVEVLGDSVRSHIENFDWEAYGAYEKDVFDERSAFNRRIRATIELRQARRKFAKASRRLLEDLEFSVIKARRAKTATPQTLSREAQLLTFRR